MSTSSSGLLVSASHSSITLLDMTAVQSGFPGVTGERCQPAYRYAPSGRS